MNSYSREVIADKGDCTYSGTSVLGLNLFQKTLREVIRSKTKSFLLPDRCMSDHPGIGVKGLSGRELRPQILLDN